MEIIYKAFDGKIFYNEDECIDYEKNKGLEEFRHDIVCLDKEGNSLPITLDTFEKCYYVNIKNEKAADYLFDIDASIPQTTGMYFYEDGWLSLTGEIQDERERLGFLLQMKDSLEG